MKTFLAITRFLRLSDDQDRLSLTNIAIMLTLGRLLFVDQVSIEALGTFLTAAVGYNVKRFAPKDDSPEETEVATMRKELDRLTTAVSAMQMAPRR